MKQLKKANMRSQIIFNKVPKHLQNKQIQDQFIKSFEGIYKRNMFAQVHTKKVLEWTHEKMLKEAEIQEMKKAIVEQQKRKDLQHMMSIKLEQSRTKVAMNDRRSRLVRTNLPPKKNLSMLQRQERKMVI